MIKILVQALHRHRVSTSAKLIGTLKGSEVFQRLDSSRIDQLRQTPVSMTNFYANRPLLPVTIAPMDKV